MYNYFLLIKKYFEIFKIFIIYIRKTKKMGGVIYDSR